MNYFISVIEDNKLVRKSVKIDVKKLKEKIIKELSYIRYNEIIKVEKLTENGIDNQIKHNCHCYSDLKPKYLVDHKNHSIDKEEQIRQKHLYIYTAYDYPELYFTMERLLMNKEIDLRILSKYLCFKEVSIYIIDDINDYIEEGYKSYNKGSREQLHNALTKDLGLAITHIEEVTERRKRQGLWLSNFITMMTLTKKEEKNLPIGEKADLEEYRRAKGNTEILNVINDLGPKVINENNHGSQKTKKIFSVC